MDVVDVGWMLELKIDDGLVLTDSSQISLEAGAG
jgi:hypothetical protein